MDTLLPLFARHGYSLLALLVFMEAVGVPVPAAIALLVAGAASAWHVMNPVTAFALALVAMVVGDWLMFLVGRHSGWALLGFLCRLSMNPETCILRSAESFYKRGKSTLVIAKFIPGINTMAPPLAGSMRMPVWRFLRYDIAGAALYIAAYFGAGFLGSRFLRQIINGLSTAGSAMEVVIIVAVMAYIAYRAWIYYKHRIYRVVPRIQVEELALRLSEEKEKLLLVDVRSHGYYDADASRIHGSIRLEPNNLTEEIKGFPRDKDIYLYCT